MQGITVWSKTYDGVRDHSQHLLTMVDAMLQQADITLADLDAIALTRGPGSFTGVRICTSMVQGLAYGAGIPVIPLSTLAVMAQDQIEKNPALVSIYTAIDARMGEVYFAQYINDNGYAKPVTEETVVAPEQVAACTVSADLGTSVAAMGTGFLAYPELAQDIGLQPEVVSVHPYPDASAMLPLARRMLACGQTICIEQLSPTYLRNNVAVKKKTGSV